MDKLARAQHAQRILDDDVVQEAFSVVLRYHTSVFEDATATDEKVLEARRMFHALNSVQKQLRSFVNDGKIIEKGQDRASD